MITWDAEQRNPANQVAEKRNSDIIKPDKTVYGHQGTPKSANPGSVIDHKTASGKVNVRTLYDSLGQKLKDVHNTDHGNPKRHPYGEHVQEYIWDKKKRLHKKITRELTELERKENSDIL